MGAKAPRAVLARRERRAPKARPVPKVLLVRKAPKEPRELKLPRYTKTRP